MLKIDHSLILEELFDRYYMTVRVTSSNLKKPGNLDEIQKDLDNLEMLLIENPEEHLLDKGIILLEKKLLQGILKIIQVEDTNYLFFSNEQGSFILRDKKKQSSLHFASYLILIFVILILLLSYLSLFKNLYPLKELQEKVRDWGEGNKTVDFESDINNEIGTLSNEFNSAITKINNLIYSRIFFLRNIMHELKTPIAKGRFSVEFLNNEEQKEQLQQIFLRMEVILSELASLEKLNSGNYSLEKKPYRFLDILDHCLENLYIEKDQCIIDVDDTFISVDFKLFSIAIKNLIDNGIKYSDSRIKIFKRDNLIEISNEGEAIEKLKDKPIEEDYFYDIKDTQNGFGFGLNIIFYIIKQHNFTISYEHKNALNIFKIYIN